MVIPEWCLYIASRERGCRTVLCQASADYCNGVLYSGYGSYSLDKIGLTLMSIRLTLF